MVFWAANPTTLACPEQKELTHIQFSVNRRHKNCIGNLGCGMGKSMAIWVHVMARYTYGTIDGTVLVVMPDRSPMEQQQQFFCKANDMFSAVAHCFHKQSGQYEIYSPGT